jgi:drug/metabolite transporter (DMT)-like permease
VDRPLLGIVLVNAGVFLWTVHDAISKWLTELYPVFELLFVRSAFALPILAVIMRLEQGRVTLATTRPWALVLRGLLSVGSFGLFLYGLRLMSLGTAFAIAMSAPLMVAGLAGPLLGEPPTRRQWIAVLVGFVAVLFMIRPGGGIPPFGALVMIVSTILFSLSLIMTRALGRTEGAGVMTFYVSLVFLACGGIALPFVWVSPSRGDLLLMATAGCLAAVALYCTTQAFRLAPVSLVVPFEYTGLVWAMLIGFMVWGEVPSASVVAAAVVIVASGLYLVREPARGSPQGK